MLINIDGVTLDGTGDPDAIFTIDRDGIEGLYGDVGVRRKRIERPQEHGDFSQSVFRESRTIVIKGEIVSESDTAHRARKDLLAGILADGREDTMRIYTDSDTRWCSVRLGQGVDIRDVRPGRRSRYKLSLHADDPRIYGQTHLLEGYSMAVSHDGNFPALPIITVDGPVNAPYTIMGAWGRAVTVTQSLSAGQSHEIDFATGGISRNGIRQMGAISHYQPWEIPPRKTVQMSISPGRMTVIVNDTYI